ncbi:MAG: HAD-IB family phosphatase [Candidatus Thermoplasmatota archaeon]|nr:HAD-IB family phosphatase [Candidatus Thermoplasmatota archaeon]
MDQRSCDYYCYRNTRTTLLPTKKKPETIQLVIFDMDGVITDTISSWKYLHDYFGTSNDHSVDAYLKGTIDDMEFIRRDVALWLNGNQPITHQRLAEILADVPLMKGAKPCIRALADQGIQTAIVSAGLDILARRVAKELGMNHVYANGIKVDAHGRLTGEGMLGVALMYKDHVVRSLSKKLDIPVRNMVAVGNSCFDIPMFETCGFGIAFNPEDDCVQDAADVVVEGKDLRKILPYLEPFMPTGP